MNPQLKRYIFIGLGIGTFALIVILLGLLLISNSRNLSLTSENTQTNSTPVTIEETNVPNADDKLAIADALKITFSGPITQSALSIKIEPKVDLNITVNGNILSLIPTSGVWNFDKKYTLTITPVENSLLHVDKIYGLQFTTYPFTGM